MKAPAANSLTTETLADLVILSSKRAMKAREVVGIELCTEAIEEISEAIGLVGKPFQQSLSLKIEKFYVAGSFINGDLSGSYFESGNINKFG